MSAAPASKVWTWQEALELPDGERYEVIDGELRERCMSTKSSAIAMLLVKFLWRWIDAGHPGWVTGEGGGYVIFPWAPGDVRMPDVAFTSDSRAARPPESGWSTVPPDLAIEVVSPNDHVSDAEDKAQDYVRAGVKLVWVVVPSTKAVHVWWGQEKREVRLPGDTLEGGDVLPDFQLSVSELFA